jgi:hypothetical protein
MDFSSIHLHAHHHVSMGNLGKRMPENALKWCTYHMVSFQTYFKRVKRYVYVWCVYFTSCMYSLTFSRTLTLTHTHTHSPNATARVDLERNLSTGKWNDIHVKQHRRILIRSGAVLQGVSLAHGGFPIVGSISHSSMSLLGYAEQSPGKYVVEAFELVPPEAWEQAQDAVALGKQVQPLPPNPYEVKVAAQADKDEGKPSSGDENSSSQPTRMVWKGVYSIRRDSEELFTREHSVASREVSNPRGEAKKKKRRGSTGSVEPLSGKQGVEIEYHCVMVVEEAPHINA